MLTTNVWWILSKKVSIEFKKRWLIFHIFYHANLEKIVYKMVPWVIYYEYYS